MNKLLKRAGNAWLIFIKNKLAGAVMMFISGLMMALAGFNGNGNDTKTLPALIALAGAIFGYWSFYRLGYVKSNMDKIEKREEKVSMRRVFWLQIIETVVYLIITSIGVYLYINEGFTNTLLDLMCGAFTILNGTFGVIWIMKNRDEKNFSWKFRIGLTIIEFGMGLYFIFASNTINATGYMIMGSITTVAGIIEIVHAIKQNAVRDAITDSKKMVRALKDEPEEDLEEEVEEEFDEYEDDDYQN